MASSSYHPRFTSSTPHFFKVILPHTLNRRKLDVPKKFVRNHGEALQAKEVCLKMASGAEWKVGLTKTNEIVWFENGWQEFIEFYSIEFGDFVIFRYEGNSCFHVIIFDKSATEIEYPVALVEFDKKKVFHGKKRFHMPEEFEDDESVQILDIKKTNEDKAQTLYPMTDKRMKVKLKRNEDLHSSEFKATGTDQQVYRANTSNSKHDQEHLPSPKIESQDLEPHKVIKSKNCWRKKPSTTASQQAIVSEKALPFKSMNPSFKVTMAPSYIDTSYLSIPISFARIHLKESKEIILQVSNDGIRVWKIWCGVRSMSDGAKKCEMRGGWKAFARDNSLEEGDICVFQLMESTKVSFKVTIFRTSS